MQETGSIKSPYILSLDNIYDMTDFKDTSLYDTVSCVLCHNALGCTCSKKPIYDMVLLETAYWNFYFLRDEPKIDC